MTAERLPFLRDLSRLPSASRILWLLLARLLGLLWFLGGGLRFAGALRLLRGLRGWGLRWLCGWLRWLGGRGLCRGRSGRSRLCGGRLRRRRCWLSSGRL